MAEATRTMRARPGTMRLFDAVKYRLPPAGVVSILHRISGLLMFVLLPFVLWLFDRSITSEISSAFAAGVGFVPGWLVKLVVLALIWSFLHHLIAGVRHVWMDVTHSVSQSQGRVSAIVTLVLSIALTALFGARLFGLY